MDFTPLTRKDEERALNVIGAASIDEILAAQIPQKYRLSGGYDIPDGCSETELRRHIKDLAQKNVVVRAGRNFLGGGIYNHFIPSVVPALWSRSEWVTSYTPYQPEVSQGILQAIFEYQTMISELTGLPVSNASLYDGASAVAEAAHVAIAHTGRRKVAVAATVHPEYLQTLATYLKPQEVEIEIIGAEDITIGGRGGVDPERFKAGSFMAESAALIVQHPNFFGGLEEVDQLSKIAADAGALLISVVDPISLGMLAPPGDYGAAIAVGEGQSLGIDPSFGGPGFGFFACRDELLRLVPGRICGRTSDSEGRTGYVLTLQAREQHIRRAKATSNICTNHQLMALASTIYLAAMGRRGLAGAAEGCYSRSHYLKQRLTEETSWQPLFPELPFFKEFAAVLPEASPGKVDRMIEEASKQGLFAGIPLGRFYPGLDSGLLIAVNEQHTAEDIDALVSFLGDSY